MKAFAAKLNAAEPTSLDTTSARRGGAPAAHHALGVGVADGVADALTVPAGDAVGAAVPVAVAVRDALAPGDTLAVGDALGVAVALGVGSAAPAREKMTGAHAVDALKAAPVDADQSTAAVGTWTRLTDTLLLRIIACTLRHRGQSATNAGGAAATR